MAVFYKCKSKIRLWLMLSAVLSIFTSCTVNENVELPKAADYITKTVVEKTNLKIGVVPGPYGDMFMEAIEPLLKEKGYTTELVYYDDYIKPNIALANKEIDLNIFQHYRYLNNFKFEYDLSLSAISEIPTASMGIFSNQYDSIQMLDHNLSALIPDDSTNLSRALRVLESAGLIGMDSSVDRSKATLNDINKNPYSIKFYLAEAHNLVKLLGDYDLSVINGNYALDGGLNLLDALHSEILNEGYINIIAARTEDLSAKFIADIIDIVYSKEYKQIILNNDIYKGFQLPRNFFDTSDWESNE